jgi:hypothetical protein
VLAPQSRQPNVLQVVADRFEPVELWAILVVPQAVLERAA